MTLSSSCQDERLSEVRRRREADVRGIFESAGLRWPAGEVFLRAVKRERQLELWARNTPDEPFKLVKTYPVLAQSGIPGPKRREGDMQVPEGFYEIDRFNPRSQFHLSLGLNYPNASDRLLGDPQKPGSDIFIHGGAASIGCLALGDPAIEEVFLAAKLSPSRKHSVHIFPARMSGDDWAAWRDAELEKRSALRPFWEQLAVGWSLFEQKRRLPQVGVNGDGSYRVESPK